MEFLTAAILGILQGMTEFLPVSSSGHLVIAQSLIPGVSSPGIMLETVLHAGTLLAIVVYFRKKISEVESDYIKLILVGTIPAALFGFIFQNFLEGLFENLQIVGFSLLFTGLLNLLTDKNKPKKQKLNLFNSLLIGIAQAVAIIPGISRSGSTIFAATKRGIDREKAAEFSFLLSIPAVLGANILQINSGSYQNGYGLDTYFVGFIFSFLSGVFAIKTVISALKKKNFKFFGFYCIFVGIVVLIF